LQKYAGLPKKDSNRTGAPLSIKRFAAARDANDLQIVSAAREMGWWLIRADEPCDYWGALKSVPERGFFAVEIKNGELARLTKNQQEFLLECRHWRLPHLLWSSIEDMIEHTAAIRGRA
jgi:hypothetical protein